MTTTTEERYEAVLVHCQFGFVGCVLYPKASQTYKVCLVLPTIRASFAPTRQKNVDKVLGCFFGACVGDAAGATLVNFIGYEPSMDEVKEAMAMPGVNGGGEWTNH